MRSALAGVGAFFAALLASSHHTIHMALLSFGVGAGVFSHFLTPGARRAMILLSLVMTGASAWWILRRPHRSRVQVAAVAIASAGALVLIAAGVWRDGW